VQVAAMMAGVRATQAERMAQDKTILLMATHGEAAEMTQRVSTLEDALVATHQAWDAVEEKILSLAAKVTAVDQWREVEEEHCEHLVHELTLLSLSGSELSMTITSAPLLVPCMRICVWRWPNKLRWLQGSLRFGRPYLWPLSPYLSACPLTLPKQVLWERWSPNSRSGQSGAHVSRLLAPRSVTLFSGRRMVKPI
jgi:hypothetical protein